MGKKIVVDQVGNLIQFGGDFLVDNLDSNPGHDVGLTELFTSALTTLAFSGYDIFGAKRTAKKATGVVDDLVKQSGVSDDVIKQMEKEAESATKNADEILKEAQKKYDQSAAKRVEKSIQTFKDKLAKETGNPGYWKMQLNHALKEKQRLKGSLKALQEGLDNAVKTKGMANDLVQELTDKKILRDETLERASLQVEKMFKDSKVKDILEKTAYNAVYNNVSLPLSKWGKDDQLHSTVYPYLFDDDAREDINSELIYSISTIGK